MPLERFRSWAVISRASDEHRVVARPWPGGEKRRGGRASHHEACAAMGSLLLPCAVTEVSLLAVWCLIGAPPRGQPWTPAVMLPHVRDGLSVLLMAVLCPWSMPSRCRHVHRQCMRNALPRLSHYRTHNCLLPKPGRRDLQEVYEAALNSPAGPRSHRKP